MKYRTAPIIIIGMHRSGTSMVADMLRRCGLFLGANREHNCENRLIIKLNQWLLGQCSARWDCPEKIDLLLKNENMCRLSAEYIRAILTGPSCLGYCGLEGLLNGITPSRSHSPWGWKDPRSTFTLPVWQKLFPDAKIIHVLRHGADVADSIIRRTPKQLEASIAKFERFRHFCWLKPKSGGFVDTLIIDDHQKGIDLWHSYARRARQHVQAAEGRAMEIRFEDVMDSPAENLGRLAEFCGLKSAGSKIDQIAAGAKASRKYSFLKNDKLCKLAVDNAALLTDFGYSPQGDPAAEVS